MNKQNNVMKATDFEKLVAEAEDGSWRCPDVVEGHVRIDGDVMKIDRINFSGVTFTGMLTIDNFKSEKLGITIGENCNLLGGLCIENANCTYVSVAGCKAKHISMWGCNLKGAYLTNMDVENCLDISGLNLSEMLKMVNVTFGTLSLNHSNTDGTIRVPKVITNDKLIAGHFNLAQIPVFLPTGCIRSMFD